VLIVLPADRRLASKQVRKEAGVKSLRFATREEVEYLLDAVRPALPDPRVAFDQVVYTYAGVRPLAFEEGAPASKVSRDHKVVVEGPEGRFLSITGTKLTCFRSLAEQVGDHVMRALGRGERSRTALLTLDGLDEEAGKIEARAWMDVSADMAATGLSRETMQTLVEIYGRAYPRVLDLARKLPDGTARLCPSNPDIVAQLHHALAEEMTVSLQDFLLRRTVIGCGWILPWPAPYWPRCGYGTPPPGKNCSLLRGTMAWFLAWHTAPTGKRSST
jgi:glycerol-3-phosphate dehydrogenase